MSTMHSLSTLEGQKLHYAAVRARLNPAPRRALPRPAPALPEPVDYGDARAPLNMLAEPSWKFLIALTSLRTGVSVKDIIGKTRTHAIAAARHEAIALVYAYSNKSLGMIGQMFGGMDHSTIFYIVQKLGAVKLIDQPGSMP